MSTDRFHYIDKTALKWLLNQDKTEVNNTFEVRKVYCKKKTFFSTSLSFYCFSLMNSFNANNKVTVMYPECIIASWDTLVFLLDA